MTSKAAAGAALRTPPERPRRTAAQVWRRSLACLLILVPLLVGCGSEGDGGSDGPSEDPDPYPVGCPFDGFSVMATPQYWEDLVDACVRPDQTGVLVVNRSPSFIDVQPAFGSRLVELETPRPSTLTDGVNRSIQESSAQGLGSVLVAPGGWVVASGDPVSVLIGQSLTALATSLAADKLAGYTESRLKTPSQATIDRVTTCANEAAGTLVAAQDPTADPTRLVLNAFLGPGLECRSLYKHLVQLTGEAPGQKEDLASEFSRVKSYVKASLLDDLVRFARQLVNVT